MELFITNVQLVDHGNFKCIAKNPRGQTDGEIALSGTMP